MSKIKYILFVGPYPPPVHGQANAFKKAYDHFPGPKILISQNLDSSNAIIRTIKALYCIAKYYYYFNRFHIAKVYLAGSRSILGSFKDLILFNIAKRNKSIIINHIHAAHFDLFLDTLPAIIKKYYKRTYQKVDVFIALLPQMKGEYKSYESTADIEVVENFYDPILDSFNNQIKRIDANEKIVISYFSNLIYSKGIFDLLDSFLLLTKKYPNLQLQIAGGFGSDGFMTAKDAKLKFQSYLTNKNIMYSGLVSRNDKLNFLKNSQIFVLPSFYSSEAFPISILEAMRCANAIIVSNHHYLPSFIDSSRGLVVEAQNINSIISAIEYLVNDPDKLLSIRFNNYKVAKENYSLRNYCDSINSIISKAY